jgi:hypothetical protein
MRARIRSRTLTHSAFKEHPGPCANVLRIRPHPVKLALGVFVGTYSASEQLWDEKAWQPSPLRSLLLAWLQYRWLFEEQPASTQPLASKDRGLGTWDRRRPEPSQAAME